MPRYSRSLVWNANTRLQMYGWWMRCRIWRSSMAFMMSVRSMLVFLMILSANTRPSFLNRTSITAPKLPFPSTLSISKSWIVSDSCSLLSEYVEASAHESSPDSPRTDLDEENGGISISVMPPTEFELAARVSWKSNLPVVSCVIPGDSMGSLIDGIGRISSLRGRRWLCG